MVVEIDVDPVLGWLVVELVLPGDRSPADVQGSGTGARGPVYPHQVGLGAGRWRDGRFDRRSPTPDDQHQTQDGTSKAHEHRYPRQARWHSLRRGAASVCAFIEDAIASSISRSMRSRCLATAL